jgi:phosphate transport system substrate-binding protein
MSVDVLIVIEPAPGSAARTIEGADVPQDFVLLIPDPPAQEAYPIIGLTWCCCMSNMITLPNQKH